MLHFVSICDCRIGGELDKLEEANRRKSCAISNAYRFMAGAIFDGCSEWLELADTVEKVRGEQIPSLVLLCHKVILAARTSGQASHQSVGEPNPDGGDGVADVAFGTERGRRGVDNPGAAQVP